MSAGRPVAPPPALEGARAIVVRAPNWIGDAVMATPALAALRAGCPDAAITVLAKPVIAEVLTHHPAVDALMVEEIPGRHAGLGGRIRLATDVRERRFNAAVLLTNSFGSALVMAWARVPCRIGYRTDGRTACLTVPIRRPARDRPPHMTDYYLGLLAPWNFVGDPRAVRLTVTSQERAAIRKRLDAWRLDPHDVLIGVNPGAAYGSAKRWPTDRFAEVARRVVRDGARIILFGSSAERSLGDEIAVGLGSAAVNTMGLTTLREAMALLTCCRHVVTNDSGPMHLAAALGVPVTAVFGPTDSRVTGPIGDRITLVQHSVDCWPCRYRDCPIDHPCMTGVSPEEVYASVSRDLAGTRRDLDVVFLDRDGTLICDEGYLDDPDRLVLLPGAADAVRALNGAGIKAVVVTNQSGVGRGLVTPEALDRIHARLTALLAASGARLDGIYACPHRPDEGCLCRKPGIDLALRAARELGVDLRRAAMIGDKAVDLELAHRIGACGVLVLTGDGTKTESELGAGSKPSYIARNLVDAVSWLVKGDR